MSNQIRNVLISRILSSEGTFEGKYTNSYNILKGIITLEEKEKGKTKLSSDYFNRFKELENSLTNLDVRIKGFSLRVVEEYFFRNRNKLDKYIYMNQGEIESNADLKVIDLFEVLENFFLTVYLMALEIGDMYALEIKLKKTSESNNEDIF